MSAARIWMQREGHFFDYGDPYGSVWDVQDIAHGLSQIARYLGQGAAPYTVAQHSVNVAKAVAATQAGSPTAKAFELAALCHDAHEFAVGDLPSPMKTMLPDYVMLEAIVEDAVRRQLGVTDSLAAWTIIADVDADIRRAEMVRLFPLRTDHPADAEECARRFEGYGCKFGAWPDYTARTVFVHRYRLICNALGRSGEVASA